MSLSRFLKDILRGYPGLLALSTGLVLLATLSDALSLFLVAPVVDLLMAPDKPSSVTLQLGRVLAFFGAPLELKTALAVFVAFSLAKALFQAVAWNVVFRTKYAVLRKLTMGTFEEFLDARWLFFTGREQGTLVNTFLRELPNVGNAFATLSQLLNSFIQLGLYVLVPLYLSWQVTLASLGAALVLALPFVLLGRYNYSLGRRNTEAANRISSAVQEGLGLAKVTIAHGNQAKAAASLRDAFDSLCRSTIHSETLNVSFPLLYQPLGLAVVAVALLTARQASVPLSEIAVLFYALLKLVPVIASLTEKKNALESYLPGYEQVVRLREDARAVATRKGGKPFTGLTRDIRFDALEFSHPGRDAVFRGLSLTVPKGRMVAFVGESGAGKTTLAELLLGLHEPSGGRILIDGTPLSELDLQTFRRRAGYVPQESLLFNMTVRDNLLWAREDATEAQLLQACRDANAEDFVSAMPKGLDTVVGDRGARLSGGQIQRLALARAILRQPDLLILDEATSSLDAPSERLIQQAVERIAKTTTTVVIAHRLSTIVNADAIFVLEGGRLAQQGTYRELLEQPGPFQRMAKLQLVEKSAP